MREKMDPYLSSSLDIFDKLIGKTNRLKLEVGVLEVQALAYIRGKSIDNTILIMEEAQNMSPAQMKTLLTRIGEHSKFIISGDLDQSDKYRDYTKVVYMML
jgi:phosphate starvation-inducible PhoH-like protein